MNMNKLALKKLEKIKCVKHLLPYEVEMVAINGEKYIHPVYECLCIECDDEFYARFDADMGED